MVEGIDVGLAALININWRDRIGYLTYYIADSSQKGKGLGGQIELNLQHYAFTVLGLNKFCSDVFTWNEKVIGIHEHFGSKIEGRRRAHIYKDGQFQDIVEMAILKDEWGQIKKDYTRIPALFEG